jgi:beta-galactosidase
VDNYPFAWTLENEYGNAADREYHPAMTSMALSMMRGLRRAPFWVTEAQTGRTFRPRRALPEPGIINAWTHQEIAHGAKAVVWFHWRQFPAGIEHLLQAVLECDGKPRRRYFEIQQTIREIKAVGAEIENACPRPEVALLRDFHCDWALDDGHTHPDFRYQRHLYLYYRALFENHVNADVIHPAENLADFKLVLTPSLLLMDEKRAADLRNYVEQGGTLVLTVQSGLRNFDNVFYRQTLPAFLTDLCGIEIEEQNGFKLQDTVGIAPVGGGYAKSRYECSLLFEIIKPTTAKPLCNYTGGDGESLRQRESLLCRRRAVGGICSRVRQQNFARVWRESESGRGQFADG